MPMQPNQIMETKQTLFLKFKAKYRFTRQICHHLVIRIRHGYLGPVSSMRSILKNQFKIQDCLVGFCFLQLQKTAGHRDLVICWSFLSEGYRDLVSTCPSCQMAKGPYQKSQLGTVFYGQQVSNCLQLFGLQIKMEIFVCSKINYMLSFNVNVNGW